MCHPFFFLGNVRCLEAYVFTSDQLAFSFLLRSRHEALSHAGALALVVCLPLLAQEPTAKRPNIPDHFTNLPDLLANISKPELMGIMKQFNATMKVRCSYCHTVYDDLSEGSFASDEKSTEEEARKLMRLTHQAKLAPIKPLDSALLSHHLRHLFHLSPLDWR